MNVALTTRFQRDVKRAKRRGKDLEKLWAVVRQLRDGVELAPRHRPHRLRGSWSDYWECHIEPDWLLVWAMGHEELILARTGTHSDLFG
ncbi:MAG: type II toxin-antitoxin system YafQ family toxin [Chloroflexi bacterium]|nr:type II toxin-antitoxin system YafQ family toxin [Chloroflexota bacterium]